jgi:DNA repair protein RadC
MGPSAWPAEERPRERLTRLGAATLSDAELLALLIGTGLPGGRHVFEVAMDLLKRFDGLPGLDGATVRELTAVPGIGPAKAAVLKAALELGRRSLVRGRGRAPVRRSADLHALYRSRFHGADREIFVCAYLDTGLRPLGDSVCAIGSAAQCLVDARLVLKEALVRGASAIAVLHNHPSGTRTPSAEDRALTARIAAAAEAVGIALVDHLIVCDDGYFSFADGGLLNGGAGARPPGTVTDPGSCDRPSPWSPCRP